jgi:hypothetical protein
VTKRDQASILDVFDNVLDGRMTGNAARKLSDAQLLALDESLNDFHSAWEAPEQAEGELRTCLTGLMRGSLRPADPRIGRSRFESFEEGRREYLDRQMTPALLYGHSTLAGDPFENLFREEDEPPRVDTLSAMRELLPATVDALAPYSPLIRDGALILVPMDAITEEIQLLSREETNEIETDLVGDNVTWEDVEWSQEELRVRTVHLAARCGARFFPADRISWEHYAYRLRRAQQDLAARDIDLRVVAALGSASLPSMRDVSAQTLADIRRDEDAFSEWRANLRSVVRTIEGWPPDLAFEREAGIAVADYLEPAAAEIWRATGRKASMRSWRDEGPLRFVLGGALAGSAAAAAGGSILSAVLGSLAGTITAATLASLYPSRPSGAGAVIARLMADTT